VPLRRVVNRTRVGEDATEVSERIARRYVSGDAEIPTSAVLAAQEPRRRSHDNPRNLDQLRRGER